MPELLANGKLGDVVTSGLILDYIKKPLSKVDYSWLGGEARNVHFIDTSVFVEILKVPNFTEHYGELMNELKQI